MQFDLTDLMTMISKPVVQQTAPKADPVRPKRCQMADCRMKLGLTDPVCKCSGFYCSRHRFADDHSCAFDYKGEGMNKLKAQLTEVRGIKLDSI